MMQNERLERHDIPYVNIVGNIMYSMIVQRLEIMQATRVTSRFMMDFGKEHWAALKWII